MAHGITMQQTQRTLQAAKRYLQDHRAMIGCVIQGAEAFAAPLLLGIGEGRLAKDGSGHVEIAGVPLNLALGAIGVGAAASGWIPEYSSHIANAAAGLLGSYGADLGRQVGLGMRMKAGKGVQANLLDPVKKAKIELKLKEAGKPVPADAPPAGARIGEDFQNQYFTIGATPGPLTAAQLEQMVRDAAAANR